MIRAFAHFLDHSHEPADDALILAAIKVTALGENRPVDTYCMEVGNLDPSDRLLMDEAIRKAVQSDLENKGVTFGVFDTVVLR